MRKSQRLSAKRLLAACLGLVALGYYCVAIPQLSSSRSFDFAIYYVAAAAARAGLNPYAPKDFAITKSRFSETPGLEVDRATETPSFILFIEPLTCISYKSAFRAWTTLNLLAFATGMILLLRPLAGRLDRDTVVIIVALAALYHPITSNLSFGQSKLILFFLLCVMIDAMSRENDILAGASLAAAALLRAFPVLLIGYLLMRRRIHLLLVTTIAIVVGGFATLLAVGPANAFEFLIALPYLTTKWVVDNLGNIALNAVIARRLSSLTENQPANLLLLGLGRILAYAPGLIALIFTLRVTASRVSTDNDLDRRLLSLWISTTLMILPVEWEFDLVVLLIPLVLIAVAQVRGEVSRRTVYAAATSYILPTIEWLTRHASYFSPGHFTIFLERFAVGLQPLAIVTAYLASYWFVTDIPELRLDRKLSVSERASDWKSSPQVTG